MSNQYLWARITGPDPNLRAADADRERVADRLRKSHAEGRLDLAEFQERLERCYEAKTLGDLSALVTDLPRQDEQDQRRGVGRLRPLLWRLPLAPILIALIVISIGTEHLSHHVFSPWIPLLLLFLVWRMSWWHRRGAWARPRRHPDDWL